MRSIRTCLTRNDDVRRDCSGWQHTGPLLLFALLDQFRQRNKAWALEKLRGRRRMECGTIADLKQPFCACCCKFAALVPWERCRCAYHRANGVLADGNDAVRGHCVIHRHHLRTEVSSSLHKPGLCDENFREQVLHQIKVAFT
jgi:hypothetical protein